MEIWKHLKARVDEGSLSTWDIIMFREVKIVSWKVLEMRYDDVNGGYEFDAVANVFFIAEIPTVFGWLCAKGYAVVRIQYDDFDIDREQVVLEVLPEKISKYLAGLAVRKTRIWKKFLRRVGVTEVTNRHGHRVPITVYKDRRTGSDVYGYAGGLFTILIHLIPPEQR